MLHVIVEKGRACVTSVRGTEVYPSLDALPSGIYSKLIVLLAIDPGAYIEGIGRRSSYDEGISFWVEENATDRADGSMLYFAVPFEMFEDGLAEDKYAHLMAVGFQQDFGIGKATLITRGNDNVGVVEYSVRVEN